MNIKLRKHWKNIVLCIVAIFWAGCEDNPSSTNEVISSSSEKIKDSIPTVEALYGVPSVDLDTEKVIGSCSSIEFSSSSSILSSSSSSSFIFPQDTMVFKLASDSSVTCSLKERQTGYLYLDPYYSCDFLMSKLEKDTLSLEDIIYAENKLKYCDGPIAVYGSPPMMEILEYHYVCSNKQGCLYPVALNRFEKRNCYVVDNLIYTAEEYKEKFMSSSNSSDDVVCNRTDFEERKNIVQKMSEEQYKKLEAFLSDVNTPISQEKRKCIETLIDIYKNREYKCENRICDPSIGYIAKTLICSDGTTSENQTYTDFLKELSDIYEKEVSACDETNEDHSL